MSGHHETLPPAQSDLFRKGAGLIAMDPKPGTQQAMVLGHLQGWGPITPLQALEKFRIMRLAAVVFDLKALGWPVRTTIIRGGRKRWAQYSL